MIVALHASGVASPGDLTPRAAGLLLKAAARREARERVQRRQEFVVDSRAVASGGDLRAHLREMRAGLMAFLRGKD